MVLEFDFVSTDANFRQALLPPMPDEVFEQFMREIYGVSKNVLVRDRHTGKTNRPGVSPFPPPSIRFMGGVVADSVAVPSFLCLNNGAKCSNSLVLVGLQSW